MSHSDYEVSKNIAAQDWPFYALIMAAMRQADTHNLMELQMAFPLVYSELKARYNAPGGILSSEKQQEAV